MRNLEEFLHSIEFQLRPPFVRLMPISYLMISDRLKLALFLDASGKPKVYLVTKSRGLKDRLNFRDSAPSLWFPAPAPSFRAILKQQAGPRQQKSGGHAWLWSKDGKTLLAYGDGNFYFTRDEAQALYAAIFEGERNLTGESH